MAATNPEDHVVVPPKPYYTFGYTIDLPDLFAPERSPTLAELSEEMLQLAKIYNYLKSQQADGVCDEPVTVPAGAGE